MADRLWGWAAVAFAAAWGFKAIFDWWWIGRHLGGW